MNIDIAYIVSHGFAARMVTQTDLLGKLVKEGLNVALICPDKNDSNLKAYCGLKNVHLYEFNENGKLGNQQYMFKRKYFLEDLKKNTALWEKHVYSIKYNKSKNPLTHIWPRYYGMIYRLISFFPSIRKRFKNKENGYLKSDLANQILDDINPKKLVATYPVNFNEAVLLKLGNERKNTETWIHLLSWDNISCKGFFPALSEKYIAWGDVMKSELVEYYGIEPENIFKCGVPHFDFHSEVKRRPNFKPVLKNLGLKEDANYLFFAMSSPRFAPKEIDIVEWLANAVETQQFNEKSLQLIVRPHPQNVSGKMKDKTWLPRLKNLAKMNNVVVDFPNLIESKLNWSMDVSDMEKFSQLLTGSLITLNSGSTVAIDALIHEKPVILTSFDGDADLPYWKSARRLVDYNHLKKVISYNGISVVNSFDHLKQSINEYIGNPEYLINERKETIDAQVSEKIDSTKNVVKCLAC